MSVHTLLVVVLALLAACVSGQCDIGSPYFIVSNVGDQKRSLSTTCGIIVTQMDVWYGTGTGDNINGVRLHYADGTTSPLIGRIHDQTQSIKFTTDNPITQFLVYQSPSNKYLVRFEISMQNGDFYQMGRSGHTFGSTVTLSVGSGVLSGLGYSWDTSGTQRLAFLFYKPIQSYVMQVNNYINAPTEGSDAGFQLSTVAQQNEPAGQNWHFVGMKKMTVSHQWSSSVANMFGASITVSGTLFGAGVSATASWSITTTTGTATTITTEDDIGWDITGNYASLCTAKVWTANLNLQWSGNIVITFQDSSLPTRTQAISGTYNNVVYSSVTQSCPLPS